MRRCGGLRQFGLGNRCSSNVRDTGIRLVRIHAKLQTKLVHRVCAPINATLALTLGGAMNFIESGSTRSLPQMPALVVNTIRSGSMGKSRLATTQCPWKIINSPPSIAATGVALGISRRLLARTTGRQSRRDRPVLDYKSRQVVSTRQYEPRVNSNDNCLALDRVLCCNSTGERRTSSRGTRATRIVIKYGS
jgi:hypothetical protein